MTKGKEIPGYVVELQRYQRHLASTLRIAEEHLNNLIREQISLLETRKKLLSDLHSAVLERWDEEQNRAPEIAAPLPASEEAQNGE